MLKFCVQSNSPLIIGGTSTFQTPDSTGCNAGADFGQQVPDISAQKHLGQSVDHRLGYQSYSTVVVIKGSGGTDSSSIQ